MIKLLCIIEVHDATTVEQARAALDNVRMQMTDNEIDTVTIYQATPDDLADLSTSDIYILKG